MTEPLGLTNANANPDLNLDDSLIKAAMEEEKARQQEERRVAEERAVALRAMDSTLTPQGLVGKVKSTRKASKAGFSSPPPSSPEGVEDTSRFQGISPKVALVEEEDRKAPSLPTAEEKPAPDFIPPPPPLVSLVRRPARRRPAPPGPVPRGDAERLQQRALGAPAGPLLEPQLTPCQRGESPSALPSPDRA